MSRAGAASRGYEAELQKGLTELRARREELHGRIRAEEAERERLQGQIATLTQRLLRSSESLARLLAEGGELDRLIAETEAAYGQILESSQTFLKEETGNAGKASGLQRTSKEKEKQAHGQKHP